MVKQHRSEQVKVLSGKTFFFDLKGSPATRIRALEIHLKGLGGIVQTVFTKSTNFLITNQQLVGERRLRSAATVPSTSSRRFILEKAALWRVEIKHIDQVSKWTNSLSVNKKPIKTTNKISSPLRNRTQNVRRNVIKVEDNSRKYRPTTSNISKWPMVVPSNSPVRSGMVTRKVAKKQVPALSTRRTAVTGTALNKPQGYCESCDVRFVNAVAHFKSAKHLKFISNEKNYENFNKELQKGKTVHDFLKEMADLDSNVTTRQRSAPASILTTRTPKRKTGSKSSNSVPSTFRTPARGVGALSSPPSDVSVTPLVVSSRPTSIGHSVKRKLFFDDNEDNDEPRVTKNAKKQNKAIVSGNRGRRSSSAVQNASTSVVTTRQRSAPASTSTTRTPKQTLRRKRRGSSSSNRVPSTFRTPVRGVGALSSPPSDVSVTPMVVSPHPTAIGQSVKRKLFFDDSNEDNEKPNVTKNTKKQNKSIVGAKRGRRSSNLVQDLQERLRHLPDVNAQKIQTVPTMHKTRRSSQKKKTRNSASIRRIVSTLKEGLKSESPVLTSMEMRNGKMKLCNTK